MSEPFTPEQEARIRQLLRDELAKPETIAAILSILKPVLESATDKELLEAFAQLPPIGGGQSSIAGGRP